MNIWLINHYAVPPQYYPLARQTYFAKYLMAMGHTVTIFAASTVHNSTQNLITDGRLWRKETVNDINYVYINCRNYNGNGLKRVFNICEFAYKLPGICKLFSKPDAIVATSMPPTSCAVGIYLARKYRCKGIAEIADLWPESLIEYGIAGPKNPIVLALRRLERWIYCNADAVIFTCEGGYDYIAEQKWQSMIPRSKVHYINNGVDLELFRYNRDHFQIEDADLCNSDRYKVVYVGSIRQVNNLGLLLDAAKMVTDPDIQFLIWGDGSEREMLEQRVRSDKISNVIFKGRVDKKYIPYIVSKADINLIHNSPQKLFRFGISFNKIFDYMAAGKPMLADFPCVHNPAVQVGACRSVDDPTPENIARALIDIKHLPQADYSAMCKNAERGAEQFDFKNLTTMLLEVITNCADHQ